MAKIRNGTKAPETKTIAWFQHEIVANTPKQSILDATSLGIFSIAEQSGKLVGAWKQHRLLMQDLDTELVAVALGDLLAALAQTADAIGMSLDAIADQQIEQVRAQSQATISRRKAPAVVPVASLTPPSMPPAKVAKSPHSAAPIEMQGPVDTVKRRPGRPRKTPPVVPVEPIPTRSAMPVPDIAPTALPRRRAKQPSPQAEASPVESLSPPKRRRQHVEASTVQPALLIEPVAVTKRASKSKIAAQTGT